MKLSLLLTATAMLISTGAAADIIAPAKVEFSEYGEIADSLTGQPGDPVRGLEVMTTRSLGNCIACHEVTELEKFPFHGEVGPSLDGVATRWEEPAIRGIIVNAKRTFPESIMPAFYHSGPFIRPGNAFTGEAAQGELDPLLTAQDIEDIVAFLMTLDKEYE